MVEQGSISSLRVSVIYVWYKVLSFVSLSYFTMNQFPLTLWLTCLKLRLTNSDNMRVLSDYCDTYSIYNVQNVTYLFFPMYT